MNYRTGALEDIVVSGSKVGMGDANGDYLPLRGSDAVSGCSARCCWMKGFSLRWWVKAAFVCLCLGAAAAAFLVFCGPLILKKVVMPILDWEIITFSRPILGLLIFASIALFPSLLLPSAPSMWLAGITFGYGYGFLLIMAGTCIGMSLPFFIGSLFCHRIHRWLEKWPKKATIVRLAGEGDWFHQFRAVTLIRISPFPYIIFNYAAVATNVKYDPYICGSLVGTVPETFLTIYSGRLLGSLADAANSGSFMSMQQILYDVLGFAAASAATAAITIYAKRALQSLQTEDELA